MLARVSIFAFMAACVAAQNFTIEEFFNASSISATEKIAWCTAQKTVCSTLCSGDASNNTCSNTELTFGCTCAANGSAPGLIYYENTIDTFECNNAYSNCIIAHPNDLSGQTACKSDILDTCGTLDSTNQTFGTTTTSSASATAAPTSTGSASAVSASTTASSTANAAAAMAVGAGQQYGMGALAAGALAAFGFML